MIPESSEKLLNIIRENPGLGRKQIADIYGVDFRSASINTGLSKLKAMKLIDLSKHQTQKYEINQKGRIVLDLINQLNAFCEVDE